MAKISAADGDAQRTGVDAGCSDICVTCSATPTLLAGR